MTHRVSILTSVSVLALATVQCGSSHDSDAYAGEARAQDVAYFAGHQYLELDLAGDDWRIVSYLRSDLADAASGAEQTRNGGAPLLAITAPSAQRATIYTSALDAPGDEVTIDTGADGTRTTTIVAILTSTEGLRQRIRMSVVEHASSPSASKPGAELASLRSSGVSQQNRLVQGLERPPGTYYWVSYDFAADAIDQENLFVSPISPASR